MRGQKEVESWSGCVSGMSLGQELVPDLNQATAADHSLHSSSAAEETDPVKKKWDLYESFASLNKSRKLEIW